MGGRDSWALGAPSETGTGTKRQGLSKPSMPDLHPTDGRRCSMPGREPAREDFTAFRDVLTLMTNQPRWDSVQPARSRGEQTPSADAVQVLGGTSRRKAAAVSITQNISRRKCSVRKRLGSRVVRPARFFCATSAPRSDLVGLSRLLRGAAGIDEHRNFGRRRRRSRASRHARIPDRGACAHRRTRSASACRSRSASRS